MRLLDPFESMVIFVDIQEKLLPTIYKQEELLANLIFSAQGFNCLEIPILITEQYPKGLGPTVSSLKKELPQAKVLEKTEFSAFKNDAIKEELIRIDKKDIILVGIEAHICILQTAFDLLQHGFHVHIPHDGISSSQKTHKKTAIQRLQQAGAQITSTESCLFEIMQTSKHPQFKEISQLLKNQ